MPEACRLISCDVFLKTQTEQIRLSDEYYTVIGHSRSFKGKFALSKSKCTLYSVDKNISRPPSSQSKITHYNAIFPAFVMRLNLSSLKIPVENCELLVENVSDSYKALMEIVWLRQSTYLNRTTKLIILDSLREQALGH